MSEPGQPAPVTPQPNDAGGTPPAQSAAPAQPPAQPAAQAQPAASAEPQYNFTLPQDSLFDASAVERATTFAKGHKLTPEAAQQAMEYAHAETKAFFDKQKTDYTAKVSVWEQSVKDDKDMGGEHFTRTLKRTTSVMDRFAKPGSHKYADELRTALNETGFGNYPPFVWLMDQIGASMEADGQPIGNGHGTPEQKSLAQRMFPNLASQNT